MFVEHVSAVIALVARDGHVLRDPFSLAMANTQKHPRHVAIRVVARGRVQERVQAMWRWLADDVRIGTDGQSAVTC